ncbi:MAG: Stage III sporulation protein AD [Thermoanaerobacterales bacterium 50_218]|nr:MAG: Stage III sporulation protein AD [Thermoanaerobacterales bacterium 50_218]HAA89373.1 stage III sporulation protein AD [Peptococcaceae bacterium]
MEVLQVVGIGLVITVLAVLIRGQRPEFAVLLALGFGILVFLLILDKVGVVISVFRDLSRKAQIEDFYLTTLLKVLGIAYVAEFGAQICRDAGEGAIASKIELAGKVLIVLLALPILTGILEAVVRLLP